MPPTSPAARAILGELRGLRAATTPAVRVVRRRYSKLLAGEPPAVVLAIAKRLLAENTWPARLVAFELIAGHRGARARLRPSFINAIARGLDDWGSVDTFGTLVAGVAWREGQISDGDVRRWTRSGNRWHRRLALVATVALNSKARGGAGDRARTLAICDALADDRDDMVVKALSWALRELAKRDAAAAATFLRREHARLAPRVRREVRNKLETGYKVPKRARS